MKVDKTHIISQENRRLDTLAKLLTGKSVCAAVTFFYNGSRKELFISTNKLSSSDAKKLNEYYSNGQCTPENLNPASKKLKDTLDLLIKCSLMPEYSEDVKESLFPYVVNYLIRDNFFSSGNKVFGFYGKKNGQRVVIPNNESGNNPKARGLNGFTSLTIDLLGENNEIIPFIEQTHICYFTQKQNTLDFYKIFCDLMGNKSGILKKLPKLNYMERTNPKGKAFKVTYIEEFFKYLSKVKSDINKICQILFTEEFDNLKSAIKSNSFILVGPHGENKGGNKSCHAEMNIISYLLQNEYTGLYYLGVSKLTCFDCSNDILVVNQLLHKLTIETRGEHNAKYSNTRISPDFKELNSEYLALYRNKFSELPFNMPKKVVEYYEFSDSDPEVEGMELTGQVDF